MGWLVSNITSLRMVAGMSSTLMAVQRLTPGSRMRRSEPRRRHARRGDWGQYRASAPPSTVMLDPVMRAESSEARNTTEPT